MDKQRWVAPTAEMAERIALTIANCDFRVTLSRYVTGEYPWVVTIGENYWQRHVVIETATPYGFAMDAELAILSSEESAHFGYDIDRRKVDRRMTLRELIFDSHYNAYGSVLTALRPAAVMSDVS